MNEETDIILSRYFSGEANQKDLRNLDIWLAESDENEKYFHQLTMLYQHTGQTNSLPKIDTENALAHFKNYINKTTQDIKISKTSKFKAYEPSKAELSMDNEHLRGDVQRKNLKNLGIFYRAAAVITLLAVAAFTLYYITNQNSTVQLIAVETNKDRTLFKNTDVTLFAGSEIIYNADDANDVIHLQGKATFNVHSKTSEGITVKAGEVCIKDIGTIFTVDASTPDKSIMVEVAEGEVWFYANINHGIEVKANEAAVYNVQTKQFMLTRGATQAAEADETDEADETADAAQIADTAAQAQMQAQATTQNAKMPQTPQETKGQQKQKKSKQQPVLNDLVFQNMPLQDAIDIIKKRYAVNIKIVDNSKAKNKILLNASFDKNESLEHVLEVIAETVSANLSKKGSVYTITI